MQLPFAGASQMKHFPLVLAIALVALSFVGAQRPAATGPVSTALASASTADRAAVGRIYRALGDVMARDKGQLITTTSAWRAVYQDALRLAAGGTDLVGKYPGLDKAVEAILAKHYTQDNVPVDETVAGQIVAACREVERQCE
jgi:hypothetical protein